MILLMGTILLGVLLVGTAALAGHPLYLIAAGAGLSLLVLLLARQRHTMRTLHRR